jgi:shikimate kinase
MVGTQQRITDVVLIGPVAVGKSTVARVLGDRVT